MRRAGIPIMAVLLVALAAFYAITSRPELEPLAPARPSLWSLEMDRLVAVTIRLPAEGRSEAWVRHDDQAWYFDRPNGPKADVRRWGGGIPLLLSGPRAERLIAAEASAEQLAAFGLDNPKMEIDLVLEDRDAIKIAVGDGTPDGQAYYIRLIESSQVYSVHQTWHAALERLVLDPPYAEDR
jgi:hypothetical protein